MKEALPAPDQESPELFAGWTEELED